jgi:DNA-binding transcriptional LysR family regulator
MTDRLSLDSLRYASAVSTTASFSAAARACGVSQPALSNSIAKLEERLGARLFERSTRGVKPTAFGAQLLPMIDRALADVDAIATEARRLNEDAQYGLRLGVSPLIDPRLVARAFAAVREFPLSRDLVLREANMQELRDELVAGELDVIVVPAVETLPAFEHRVIDAEPVVVVGPGTDTADEPIELADTVAAPLILVPNACGLTTFTNRLFDRRELPVQTYAGEAASYRVLEQWANLGLGSAILPLSKLSSPNAPHRVLLDGRSTVEIRYEAVWRPGSPLAADIEMLATHLAETAASATVDAPSRDDPSISSGYGSIPVSGLPNGSASP